MVFKSHRLSVKQTWIQIIVKKAIGKQWEVLSSVACPLVCLPDSSGDFNLMVTQKDFIKSRGHRQKTAVHKRE